MSTPRRITVVPTRVLFFMLLLFSGFMAFATYLERSADILSGMLIPGYVMLAIGFALLALKWLLIGPTPPIDADK